MKLAMKLNFDNHYARLGDRFSAPINPRPLPNPRMVSVNARGADLIGLDTQALSGDVALKFFSGADLIDGAAPLAMVYSGHQFGIYVPRLGDGRGLLLGQVRNQQGQLWDVHLKGAGQTPFSRGADGRAVLRSSIREYLASEALHQLGIPTSRALCLIGSDEPVMREQLETAACLIRLSESHVRFGTFEYFSYTGQIEQLSQLADYVIDIHYPELRDDPQPYDRMLLEITSRTADMIAHWQAFGFAHGVMNTDNMSILGQTFDFGPYGFMEAFDPEFICNHSDHEGRYAFDQQPQIGLWNCRALAHALKPLTQMEDDEQLIVQYQGHFFKRFDQLMARKLGLEETQEGDREAVTMLLGLLANHKIDYTIFFRHLSEASLDVRADNLPVLESCPQSLESCSKAFESWFAQYRERLKLEKCRPEQRREKMLAVNPKYILRNHLAQTAIEFAERGDYGEIDRLLKVLSHPFDDQPEYEDYALQQPEGSRPIVVSCSS